MNHSILTQHQYRDGQTPSRPTIALLADGLTFHIPISFLRAATAVAKASDVNLLYFSCDPMRSPYGFEIQANILYDLANTTNVNGVLIASTLVGSYISIEEMQVFFHRYHPVPMVSMGLAMGNIPSVMVDNFTGMYAVITHLIKEHGYRRIAFLGGPSEHSEAQERYRAYTTALHDHGLTVDPGMVIFGDFKYEFGARAVQTWLDERQYRPSQDLEAIVAVNDYMAVGVLFELQTRGIAVPTEIAVTGFDDVGMGRAITPPLTTVRQPFEAIGRRATELLLAQLAGQTIPQLTPIPAELVVRESCGCTASPDLLPQPPIHLTSMPDNPMPTAPRPFFQHLNRAIVTTPYCDMTIWEPPLALLRQEQAAGAGSALQTILGESMLLSLQEQGAAQVLQSLGEQLISTLNVAELMDALAKELPQLGIRSGYVALYDDPPPYQFPQPIPAWSRLILAYDAERRITLPVDGLRFPTHELVPPEILSAVHTRQMVVEALYFQREQIGFTVFEVGTPDERTYHMLRRYLSSALQGALLVQRVQERSAEIARQKYILDTFLETVPDRIWFKDREGRYLRANQAHARRWGLYDPSEEIGKTDRDLMLSSTAEITNADEHKILITGVPLLNKEAKSVEPDGSIRWSLVTKMPLQDEHGAIIGTFGIARDITELKNAQSDLEQRSLDLAAAYEEIEILNDQLHEENLRMGAELGVSRRIQQMVLPTPDELQQITGLDIVGYMQPADEVGGDYYDVLQQHGVLHIGIGDVTGHGLESGILMLMTQTAIRTLIEHGETDSKAFLTTLNRVILKNSERMQVDKILTFVLITYQDGYVHIVGQHEEILILRQGGQIERIDTVDLGFPIGLETEIDDFVDEAAIRLQPGDSMVLYTDGITEAENPDHQMYGLDRLCEVLSRHWDHPAEAMKQAVVDDVIRHIGTQKVYDDITLVVLKQK